MPRTLEEFAIFAAPGVFVVLWASGFIGAKFGLGYAEPLTFLALRMIAVVVLLGILIVITRPKWPSGAGAVHSAVTGLLVHGCYLGGVFVSIENGLSAGLIALIVSLQPVLTSTVANRWLGERVAPRQWLGLFLGLLGVFLVLHDKTVIGNTTPLAWAAAALALVGITIGTLYQKRFGGGIDWRTGMWRAICRGRHSFLTRRRGVRDPRCALDAPIRVRALLARIRDVIRRHMVALFPHSPRGGDARGELVLSHAGVHGSHGVAAVRRTPRALGAPRHGHLHCRRVPGELAGRWCGGLRRANVPIDQPIRRSDVMSARGAIDYRDASPEVRAVFDDIKRTRQVEDVNNFWKYLAQDPATLKRTWESIKDIMAPGALDVVTKEMIYLAVSVSNGCGYCIASHGAAARKAGMTEAMFGELMAVVGMANETNRLANGYRVPIDPAFER